MLSFVDSEIIKKVSLFEGEQIAEWLTIRLCEEI